MPREAHDPDGYGRPRFNLEEKWVTKISKMPARPDGTHFVRIHLKNGSICKHTVVNCDHITQHTSFRDEDIVDITSG